MAECKVAHPKDANGKQGTVICVEIDEDSTQLSKSEKTYVLASSSGFQPAKDSRGRDIMISYNVVRKK